MIRYCKTCLFPETKPDLYFDNEGICDACHSAKRIHGIEKAIDWDARARQFQALCEDARTRSQGVYNCIVPASGGKDSCWQVYALKTLHKMKPLVVTFDQFDQTPVGKENLEFMRGLGVDHVHFTLNPEVVRNLVKKGFETVGDPYWINHVGIFTVPFHFALRFGIPMIVYGENPQLEYGGPELSRDNMVMDRRWRQEFGGMRGFREEDMVDNEISIEDLSLLCYPSDEEVKQAGLLGTFYGYFYKWDALTHVKLMQGLGWRPLESAPAGSWLDYENCDMRFIDIRERIKFLKYGYGRATDQLNIWIRNGRIARAEALEIVKRIDGNVDENNIVEFCNYLSISRSEYEQTMDTFVNTDLFVRDSQNQWVLAFERF